MPPKVTVGGVASIEISRRLGSSTFSATSTARWNTDTRPSVEMEMGAVYKVQVEPSKLYSVRATPELSSVAERVTVTPEVYQPLAPGLPATVATEIGGAMSPVAHEAE